ncbi:hypothetical protein RB653_002523 [Dictyostelium firmibasis]|uniref:Transmembrane protein n=1 Tax=Dictyostelium firmibasis TaxID=79012 RepID=A0AAN7YYS2_9MYCE
MNKFKIPTCTCENCRYEQGAHSENIIIPTQLPKELEGFLTFDQYKLLANECRKLINRSDMAYKFGIGSFLIGTLLSLLYIWFHKNIISLIILSVSIITIFSSGIIISLIIIKSTQKLLDKKINEFNIDFNSTSKGFRIEKSIKQYSNSNEESETISKLTLIYIVFNIDKQNNSETVIEIESDNNEIITHKFQDENKVLNENDIISLSKDNISDTCSGIIINNVLKNSRGIISDRIVLLKQH